MQLIQYVSIEFPQVKVIAECLSIRYITLWDDTALTVEYAVAMHAYTYIQR